MPYSPYLRWTAALLCGVLLLTAASSTPLVDLGETLTEPIPMVAEPIEWTSEELQRPPNIIIVLSESFWDITQLPDLKFSRDPAPFFHSLQEKYTHGTLLSPMFGGGTANVELEVLTGLSYRFFPEGSIVYEQYIKQPTESLASILRNQGYATTAVSPFHHWFFNSSQVYRDMGFERLIPLEFFNPDEFSGPYMGDHAVAKRIMEESDRSSGADFIFANTMENHYHYFPGKFKRNSIEVTGPRTLAGGTLGIVETYAQGMQAADRMLQELVAHFSRVHEPTVLVFFGDHMPSLEKYSVYENTGYITGPEDPDFLEKMHHVPVVVWSNYLPPENREELHLSPAYLGPYVLELAERPGSSFTRYLSELAERLPVLPPADYYEQYGVDPELAASYQARQEAQMESYLLAQAAGANEERPFILGYGPPEIAKVTPSSISLGSGGSGRSPQLTLTGGRYGLGCIVYSGAHELPTIWNNESSLSVTVPKELLGMTEDTLPLQIQVVDSKGTAISSSEVISVPVERGVRSRSWR